MLEAATELTSRPADVLPPRDSEIEDHLRGRQLYHSEQNVAQGLAGLTLVTLLTAVFFYREFGSVILVWSALMIGYCGVRMVISRRIIGRTPQPVSARQMRPFIAASAFSAFWITSFPMWVAMNSEGFTFAYMLALGLGTFWCSCFIHAPTLRCSLAFMISQTVVFTAAACFSGLNWERGGLVVLFACGTGSAFNVIKQHSALFSKSVLQQLELENKTDVIGLLLREHEENSSDWLWQTDEDLTIAAPSSRFIDVFGALDRSMIGLPLLALFHDPDVPGNQAALKQVEQAMAVCDPIRDVVIPCRMKTGPCWFSISGRPAYDRSGDFIGYRGVMADVTAAKLAEAKIVHLAHHDALTDLPNRTRLHATLDRAFTAGHDFTLFSIDLDGFKPVNDCYGHPVGDALLIEIARRLVREVASADLVARFGGDEFIVQSWRCDPSDVEKLCRSMIAAISEPLVIGDVEVVVGASIGVAFAPQDGDNADAILKNADAALYRAKAEGRGTYRFFSPAMDQLLQERQMLIQDLRTALLRHEMVLHYQPFVDAQTGRVTGCEALLRWLHPRRGLVSPVEFIPLAEESGLIVPIGAWVIEEACREAVSWPGDQRVSLNVSPVQFRDQDLPERILQALLKSGLSPSRLEIEVTETVLVDDPEAAISILRRIRALGVRVALDDFGTGYSSLSYLRLFAFDKIKIDRSFVRDLSTRNDSQVIVRAIRDIALGLGMTITAEGVETCEQAAQLRLTGCHEFQGFLFSKPQPGEHLAAIMSQRYAA